MSASVYDRYYVLVAACVLAQKKEWLRNACLAGALLFPAVAAFHAIVLAALHNDGEHIYHDRSTSTVLFLTALGCRCR